MIEPTLGRIVWFTPAHDDQEIVNTDDGKCVAVVTRVWTSRLVNLAVFDASGRPFARSRVMLLQDDDALPACGRFCQWMPYQVAQARKHEVLAQATEVGPTGRTGD